MRQTAEGVLVICQTRSIRTRPAVVAALACVLALTGFTARVGATQEAEFETVLTEVQRLAGSGGGTDAWFGWSVAIEGDTLLVGARFDAEAAPNAGAAYVFVRDAGVWALHQKLIASDAEPGDTFGYSVGISGDRMTIASPGDTDGGSRSGSVYVFRLVDGVWHEAAKLRGHDAVASDAFGFDVAIADRTVVVGAPQNGGRGTNAGAAYVFSEGAQGWRESAKLAPRELAPGDFFGTSVAISRGRLVSGAFAAGNDAAGAAYVYRRAGSSWVAEARLAAADAEAGDLFGNAVDIDGNRVIVGERRDGDQGDLAGAAHVFEFVRREWRHVAKLLPLVGFAGSDFGSAVAIDGSKAVVGADKYFVDGAQTGAAFTFAGHDHEWTQTGMLIASDRALSDSFGISAGISGRTAVVGSLPIVNDLIESPGAVYVYDVPAPE